jgi:hypothetical protein
MKNIKRKYTDLMIFSDIHDPTEILSFEFYLTDYSAILLQF